MAFEAVVIARERLTPSTSTGFTTSNIPPTKQQTEYVLIQSLKGDIWIRQDGETVTAATGILLPENSKVEVHGYEGMIDARFIDNGDSAELECIYMGRGGTS